MTISPTSLMVTFSAHLSGVLGLNIDVTNAQFGIFGNDSLGQGGIVIDVPLSFSAGLGSQLFSIRHNPVLIVNTSPVAQAGDRPQ